MTISESTTLGQLEALINGRCEVVACAYLSSNPRWKAWQVTLRTTDRKPAVGLRGQGKTIAEALDSALVQLPKAKVTP